MKLKNAILALAFASMMLLASKGEFYASEKDSYVSDGYEVEHTMNTYSVEDMSKSKIIAEGKCGKNLTWTLDAEGTLRIDGYGDMDNYSRGDTMWDRLDLDVKKIVFDEDMTSIGRAAFSHCSSLTGDLVIPAGIKSIGKEAFYGCSGLTGKLVISNGVQEIGDYAFYQCSGLTGDLVIPGSVETIGEYAFEECKGFTGNLVISNGVQEIGGYAFHGCSGFKGNLVISNTIQKIGTWAFCGCSGLTGELVIPGSVQEIEACAFMGCSGFTGELKISSGVKVIGDQAFDSCSGLMGELVIPGSVQEIGESAFNCCWGLCGNLGISNGVKKIGAHAFFYCAGLTGEVVIPSSVQELEHGVFDKCYGLDRIVILNPHCKLKDFFGGLPDYITIEGYENSTTQANAEKYGKDFRVYGSTEPTKWMKKLARYEKIWEILDGVDPTYHINDKKATGLTDAQYAEIQTKAKEVTANCKTQYEKIEAITEYVADTIYKDFAYFEGYAESGDVNAYAVFVSKRSATKAIGGWTMGSGYANLTTVMMNSIGIPCFSVPSYGIHEYNLAYDSEEDRWIFVDAECSSGNSCHYNKETQTLEWGYGGYYRSNFDLSQKELAKRSLHEIDVVYGGWQDERGKIDYSISCSGYIDEWTMRLTIEDFTGENISVTSIIENIPITSVYIRNCTNLKKLVLSEYVEDADIDGSNKLKDLVVYNKECILHFNTYSQEGITIHGYKNSTAYEISRQSHGHSFVALDAWQKNKTGWWYQNEDGTYPANCWKMIGDKWYAFNERGYVREGWFYDSGAWYYLNPGSGQMLTGWQYIDGKWFYLKSNGAMVTGWQYIDGSWYYLKSNGAMATGWQYIEGNWYYLKSNGAMATGWTQADGVWYYMKSSGVMLKGWQYIEGNWYYLKPSGIMAIGWQYSNGSWYYLKSNGMMATGWQYIDESWYYLKSNGAMTTGWQYVDGNWYYLYDNGTMAKNAWVGNYYVNASGAWVNK